MSASSKRALLGALAANLAIAVTKFIVGAITHSTVMVAEGIHSLVDTGNSGLMLLGRSRSRRGPDDAYPFGHGMELYFWSFLVAMVIFGGGGCLSIYEGVRALLHPRAATGLWPNYLVIAAAAIFVTVLEDVAALAGLAVAAVGLTLSHYLAAPAIDAAASMLIGAILMVETVLLGVECRGLITGESARPILLAEIRRVVSRCDDSVSVQEFQTLQLGPDTVLLLVSVRLPRTMATGEVEDRANRLTLELRRASPVIKHVAFYMAGSNDRR